MIGSAIPATATASLQTSTATPASPTRPSRLRGFTYLRNYAHEHLPTLSRAPDTPTLTRSRSSPGIATPDSLPPLPLPQERQRQVTESHQASNGREGWLPIVNGRSDLGRESLHPTLSPESASPERGPMTRTRTAGATAGPTPTLASPGSNSTRNPINTPERANTMPSSSETPEPQPTQVTASESSKPKSDPMPTIRFIPHTETRSSRPSLQFTAISRTLTTHTSVVRVGRYSERDNPTAPTSNSTVPVGFKSKVVSRRHCEFWCSNGQWYVKDVKSSSGTFLNHVRMSPPGHESKPYAVNDGDVVQLGIDFKGGEEVIFRCVKIRIECNRGWQKSLNNFNTSAHKKLFKNDAGKQSDAASVNTNECSICLNPVAPCQALFVAPCSHVWHWKCIKKIVDGPAYPHFVCPNCRFVADLDADVEPPEGDHWPEEELHEEPGDTTQQEAGVEDDEDDNNNGGVMRDYGEDIRHDGEDPEFLPDAEPLTQSSTTPPLENQVFSQNHFNPLNASSTTSAGENIPTTGHPPSSTLSRAIASSAAERRGSGTWRSESQDDLTEQARSPTPTNTTAFALAPGIETMARDVAPGAAGSKGGR